MTYSTVRLTGGDDQKIEKLRRVRRIPYVVLLIVILLMSTILWLGLMTDEVSLRMG
jgi:hypothetical protein